MSVEAFDAQSLAFAEFKPLAESQHEKKAETSPPFFSNLPIEPAIQISASNMPIISLL